MKSNFNNINFLHRLIKLILNNKEIDYGTITAMAIISKDQ